MSNELLPCPFCGGEVEIDDSEMFTCDDCGMIARFPKSPRQRKNAKHGLVINNYDTEWHTNRWNTRTERTCKVDNDYCCSECESEMVGVLAFDSTYQCYPNYCPNCGAKVVE